MENPAFWWYLPGKMGIFMGYVSFRECNLALSALEVTASVDPWWIYKVRFVEDSLTELSTSSFRSSELAYINLTWSCRNLTTATLWRVFGTKLFLNVTRPGTSTRDPTTTDLNPKIPPGNNMVFPVKINVTLLILCAWNQHNLQPRK